MRIISPATLALLCVLNTGLALNTVAVNHINSFNTPPACLNGSYTIGLGGDYVSFALAAADLNTEGVCGPVVFEVLTGVYDDAFTLTDLAGTSAINSITFQSQSGNPADVVLQSAGFSDVIVLHNTDYVTFKDLTISYSGTGAYSVIELQDDSDYTTVTNCVLNGGSSTSTTNAHALIYANETILANQCDNFTLENSTLNGAANGVYFVNSNANNVGSRITENNFTNQFRNGIYLDEFDAVEVLDNTFSNGSNANSSYTAITLNDCNNASQVLRNKIASTYIKYGIVVDGEGGTTGNEVLVANNFIAMGGDAPFNQAQGIKIAGCSYVNLYFNNVSNYNTYNTGLTCCLYISGTITDGTVNVVNNILSMTGGGDAQTAVYFFSTNNRADIGVSNYNNYYAPSPSSIAYSSGDLDLAGYQSLLLNDANSININPEFTSPTDLHTAAVGLLGAGTTIAGITTDIDGDTRATPPAIGADENGTPITGINENENSAKIYTTSNNSIVVENTSLQDGTGTLQIFNMAGQMVSDYNMSITNGIGRVQTTGLPNGFYAIRYVTADGNISVSQKVTLSR